MKNFRQENILFVECIQILGDQVETLSQDESNTIIDLFEKSIPIYDGGSRIDWRKIPGAIEVYSPAEVLLVLKGLLRKSIDNSVYIFWNDWHVPVIKTNLSIALQHFDDVTCISFETWFFNPLQGYVIEFYYLGEMHVGLLP